MIQVVFYERIVHRGSDPGRSSITSEHLVGHRETFPAFQQNDAITELTGSRRTRQALNRTTNREWLPSGVRDDYQRSFLNRRKSTQINGKAEHLQSLSSATSNLNPKPDRAGRLFVHGKPAPDFVAR